MTALPNASMTCSLCGGGRGVAKNSLCVKCRMRGLRKYVWTPALDDDLRRIYADNARSLKALREALRAFRVRIGWPRHAVVSRAIELRLVRWQQRRWTEEEVRFLRKFAGRRSMLFLSRQLRRGAKSIQCKLQVMQISYRYTEGYSRVDLSQVFGVSRGLVTLWIKRGWLRPALDTDRVPEGQVRRFLSNHSEEYDLKRVDQAWFKGMIFRNFGQHAHAMGDKASSAVQEVA